MLAPIISRGLVQIGRSQRRICAKPAAIALVGAVLVAPMITGPAPAVSPTDRVTAALFDAESGKGLVALTQGPSGSEVSFQLFGLKPKTKYRLVVSSRGCTSSKGTIVSRAFRTDGRGAYWDPAAVRSTAEVASMRIVRKSNGRTVACNTDPQVMQPLVTVSKITNASPGVLVVSRAPGAWRIKLSLGGLKAKATYQLVGLEGGCSRTAPVVAANLFKADRKGAALVDLAPVAEAGRTLTAVGVLERPSGQVVFCKVL